ncbi:MAG: efflux RND transporter periplasmic adaptor subunit [candidate division Zixibacteria bacterium]|nr:efflux RND transporter periplasmic adaptor subunit [candidate division Zixibacteria bacterium]
MVKKILIILMFVIVVGGSVTLLVMNLSASKEVDAKTIACTKGSIVDKALAVGTIVPREEISVKSNISGIVKTLHVDIGDLVKIGDPLIDIAPDPTPLEYAQAKRQVEISEVGYENAEREMNRFKALVEKKLIAAQEFESAKAKCDEMRLRLSLAEEKFALIEKGETKIAGRVVENVLKSSIDGMVLVRNVNVGDPVVPLTSYQSGTELLVMADMTNLMFKGRVDEIDVGKLVLGMPVEIKIGALPSAKVEGLLKKVSPKAHQDQGSTVFNVEIDLIDVGDIELRAGYSANADIIITKKEDILLIPERLIEFVNDTAYVNIHDTLGTQNKTPIETGLSDGINIEVTEGLSDGQLLVELPPKQIE